MSKIYVVMYNTGDGTQYPIKAFTSQENANKWIDSFRDTSDDEENDNWYDPDCCYLEYIDLD